MKISFNNKVYNISDSAFVAGYNILKNCLMTTMAGSGASILLDDIAYGVSSAKLASATTSLLDYMSALSGAGASVNIGGVNYSLDSGKLAAAMGELHTVLGGMQGGGDSGLEMNEYGFYFGVPYVYNGNASNGSFTLYADGSTKMILPQSDGVMEEFVGAAGTLVYSQNQAVASDGTIITFSDNGTKLHMDGAIFILDADVGGDSDTSGLLLNQYGFYFNAPYGGEENGTKAAFIFYEDGSVYSYEETNGEVTWEYVSQNAATYSLNQITIDGGSTFEVTNDGKTLLNPTGAPANLQIPNKTGILPIEYNTMDVIGNTTVMTYIDDGGRIIPYPLVKVSDKVPTVAQMAGTYSSVDDIVMDTPKPIMLGLNGHVYLYPQYNVMIAVIKSACTLAKDALENWWFTQDLVFTEPGVYCTDVYALIRQNSNVRIGYNLKLSGALYDDEFPIEWNTMEASRNATFGFNDVTFVKISNKALSKTDLLKLNFVYKANGQQTVQSAQETGLSFAVSFGEGDTAIAVISVSDLSTFTAAPETGLYVADIYNMAGINMNGKLELDDSDDSGLNEYGFYYDVPYVYYDEPMQTIFNWNFHADGSGTYIAQNMTGDPIVVDYPAEDLTYSQNQVEVRNAGNGTDEPQVWTFVDNGAKLGIEQEYLFQVAHPDAYDHCMTVKSGEFYGLGSVPLGESTGESMVKVSQLTPSFNDLCTGVMITSSPEMSITIPLSAPDVLIQHDNIISIMDNGAIVVQSDSAEIDGVTLTKGAWSILPSLPAEYGIAATIMWNDASDDGKYDDEFPIEWNSMEVMNNPLFALITGLRMMKISNLTPSAEELGTATLTAEVQGQTIQASLLSFGDFDGDKNVSYVHFETPLGEIFMTSVHVPTNGAAPGLYISDVATMAGVNADCRLELAPTSEVILEEQQYDFELNESFRMYMSRRPDWFSLQEGETYKVVWDGEEYTAEAYRHTFNGYDAVFLGNEGYMKGESTVLVEPFCIYRLFANDYCFLATFDTSASHTVAIYKVN